MVGGTLCPAVECTQGKRVWLTITGPYFSILISKKGSGPKTKGTMSHKTRHCHSSLGGKSLPGGTGREPGGRARGLGGEGEGDPGGLAWGMWVKGGWDPETLRELRPRGRPVGKGPTGGRTHTAPVTYRTFF